MKSRSPGVPESPCRPWRTGLHCSNRGMALRRAALGNVPCCFHRHGCVENTAISGLLPSNVSGRNTAPQLQVQSQICTKGFLNPTPTHLHPRYRSHRLHRLLLTHHESVRCTLWSGKRVPVSLGLLGRAEQLTSLAFFIFTFCQCSVSRQCL